MSEKTENKVDAEIAKLIAETSKINPEIMKLMAETKKINSENVYYPLIVGATVTLAIVAVVKLFL